MGRHQRLESIDALRGLVMVLMALDHARDFWGSFLIDPEDLSTTTPALFATRWVTHFCAPVFVLLAGTSTALWGRNRTRGQRARFLITRGLWLIVLEFTLVHMTWFLEYRGFLNLQVIAAIGVGLVALGVLVWLPVPVVGALGLAIVLGHDALSGFEASRMEAFGPLWRLLHDGGVIPMGSWGVLQVMYPVLPWIGVACLGAWLGDFYGSTRAEQRVRFLLRLGLGLTLAFVVLRATNLYGDPTPWKAQGSFPMTVISFLRCGKYPPSLCFLLMTLGPGLLLLGLLEKRALQPGSFTGPAAPLVTLGRVPLFFYLAHVLFLHVSVALFYYFQEGRFLTSTDVFFGAPQWYGHGLGVVYLAWLSTLVVLYPVCRWYAEVKRRSNSRLLSYL